MIPAPDLDAPAPRGRRLVLLIDDQPEVRRVTRRLLERAGLAVLEAESGRAGLEVIAQGEPEVSLVLTDLVMPGIGGLEVVEVLGLYRPDLPVVCVTGAASPRSIAELQRLKVPVVRKPFDPEQLTGVIRGLLDARPPAGGPVRPAGADLVSEALRLLQRREPGA
jgi:two-component system cell cycle sensor histidine kinase/response regulator CckA